MIDPRRKIVCAACLCATAFSALSCGGDEPAVESTPTEKVVTGLPPQSSQSGSVTVAVTPRDLSSQASTWVFDITVESTGPELDDDLQAAAVLVGDDGVEHPAAEYTGDGPGGTRRQGELHFEPISPTPGSLFLKIRGIGGVGERSFSWMVAP